MQPELEELRVKVEALTVSSRQELSGLATLEACERFRVRYLGRKGVIAQLFEAMRSLPDAARPEAGKLLNDAKRQLEEALASRQEALQSSARTRQMEAEALDVTLPGRPLAIGHLHLVTQTLREIYRVFTRMDFQVEQTREVESDEYNFQLLNIPPGHPARDMWSTFYTTRPGMLLRTHTSPGQIRVMRRYAPQPIRILLPGKCYRYEQVDASHEWMFYQVEGIAVGKEISMANLKGVLIEFVRQIFGQERRVDFRCSYFPFTEPSMEVAMDCIVCGGAGCPICKGTGWLEILGSGMVHPNVLQNGGYDPAVFSGFAFGMGPERIAMLKYGIEDIRVFYSNDLRFAEQFR